jgi:hypothetical protein
MSGYPCTMSYEGKSLLYVAIIGEELLMYRATWRDAGKKGAIMQRQRRGSAG